MAETISESKVAQARRLAEQGFRVFPLLPDSKIPPARMRWRDQATSDPEKVEALFADYPDANIGLATGQGIAVLDVDDKNGRKGSQTLEFMAMCDDILPPTLTVETPSGGRHIYLATPTGHDVRNSAGKLGEGLDIRGEGGYVVAPGSTIGGKPYRVIDSAGPLDEIALAPDWLLAKCQRYSPRERNADPLIELDTDAAIARVAEFLQEEAPPAIEGEGGNETTYRVAAQCRDQGVSEDTCIDLMLEHYNEQCEPPWPDEALAEIVRHAYQYAKGAPGNAAPEAVFAPVEIAGPAGRGSAESVFAPATPQRPPLRIVTFAEAVARLDTRELVEDLLGENAMSVLYGPSNVGKTFVALDIAFRVATGTPWAGKRTEKRAVVYVAAEAGRGILDRIAALKKAHGVQDCPLYVVPQPIDLFADNGDVGPLLDAIARVAELAGLPVGLVVIDTLSRAMGAGNENAPDDMGRMVRNLDRARDGAESKPHLMVVHHSGKDEARGARGHSSLRAATDTEIEIKDGTLHVTKQRDMAAIRPLGFRLAVVELGVSSRGKTVTSCVVEKEGDPGFAFASKEPDLSPEEITALDALDLALADERAVMRGGRRWVATGLWGGYIEAVGKGYTPDDENAVPPPVLTVRDMEMGQKAFERLRDRLQRRNMIVDFKRNQWSRP